MTGTDGSSYTFVATDNFFTAAGQQINQDITKTSDAYTVTVDMDAVNAESVVHHQGRTINTGFNNILTDSASITGTSDIPKCFVQAVSIDHVSYAEVTDYTGNMTAVYTGVVSAETSCDGLSAVLKLQNANSELVYNTVPVTLVKSSGMNFIFTTTIQGPNIHEFFKGKIIVTDVTNGADKASLLSAEALWAPPCYLQVVNFAQTNQDISLDHLRAVLTYNVQLAQHGDKACNNSASSISLHDGTETTFNMILDETDLLTALTNGGFDVSIQTETGKARGAEVTITDPRAVNDATAPAAGFTA